MSYPEAPWHLQGELIIVPTHVLGGVMLAGYTSGTLAYHELIVFSRATRRGMVVSHIYVDDEQSLRGGREIWGLPKELATFRYERTRFEARQDGPLLTARIRRRRGRLPLLLPAPIVSEKGAALGRARVNAAPALATLGVPHESPLAALGLSGTYLALAGDDLRLTMPPPQ
jgi:acetoacetate decarboxylase